MACAIKDGKLKELEDVSWYERMITLPARVWRLMNHSGLFGRQRTRCDLREKVWEAERVKRSREAKQGRQFCRTCSGLINHLNSAADKRARSSYVPRTSKRWD